MLQPNWLKNIVIGTFGIRLKEQIVHVAKHSKLCIIYTSHSEKVISRNPTTRFFVRGTTNVFACSTVLNVNSNCSWTRQPVASHLLLNPEPRTLYFACRMIFLVIGTNSRALTISGAVASHAAQSEYDAALESLHHAIDHFTGCSPEERAALQRDLEQLHAMAKKLEAGRVEIVVFGEISTGKSALINALVGEAGNSQVNVRGGWTKDVWQGELERRRLLRSRDSRAVASRFDRYARA